MRNLTAVAVRIQEKINQCPVSLRAWKTQMQQQTCAEEGMTTAEYAIGTIAAAAFAGLLLAVIQGGGIKDMLLNLIKQALSV